MTESQKFVVVIDFPGIKKYVFGTDPLKEIRGASALLDNINRIYVPDRIREILHGKCEEIFSGGGAGQFIISDCSKEDVEAAFADINGRIAELSGGGLQIVAGAKQWKEGEKYKDALQAALGDLKTNKQNLPPRPDVHTGFLRECNSCSSPASENFTKHGEEVVLCLSCSNKRDFSTQGEIWDGFQKHLQYEIAEFEGESIQRPEDFSQIGDLCKGRKGYTALVYADGNSMGNIVSAIETKEQFKIFSKVVDSSVREACYEAMAKHCLPKKAGATIPADILLLGGDDLMVYTSADAALPFAIESAQLFKKKTVKKLSEDSEDDTEESRKAKRFLLEKLFTNGSQHGMTISAGIAYGRSHTPISIMINQAGELLKSAKRKGVSLQKAGSDFYKPPCIDFHFTSRFQHDSVEDTRRQHLKLHSRAGAEPLYLYMAPYTLEQAERLLDHARNLRAVKSGIPSTRLHALGDAPFRGKVNGAIETLNLYTRCKSDAGKKAIMGALEAFDCKEMIPWKEETSGDQAGGTSTVMVDLVQVAQFIPKVDQE